MFLPSSGTLNGDRRNMWDPAKIGRVMWARAPSGMMAPLDLHRASDDDLEGLNHIFRTLRSVRKISPVLKIVTSRNWDDMKSLKPYIMASIDGRSEAREMIRTGDWEAFWSLYD